MENKFISNPIKNEKGFIALPFDEEQFKDFVVGLLGRTQSISRVIKGSFEITIKDIENIFCLINQRILQQNDAKLIQFNTKVVYSDNSSVLLNSFEELMTYNEVRALTTDSIHLSWQYLVKFQDKEVPEKQEIDISFIANGGHPSNIESDDLPFIFYSSGGFIPIRIKHTARTWGADIESLITNHLENLLIPKDRIKEFVRKNNSRISFMVAALFFLVSVLGCYFATLSFGKNLKFKISEELGLLNFDSQKIDYIIDLNSRGDWSQHYFYIFIFLICATVISIILGTWIDDSFDSPDPSYIIFTREDNKRKIKLEKVMMKQWRKFLISIFVSLIIGILANYIFYYIKG